MHRILIFLFLGLIWSCGSTKNTTALKEEKRIITQITYLEDEPNKIYLNEQHAFNYKKIGNDFEILNLENEKLITGSISKVNGEWESVIQFLTVDKTFSNKDIVGRNDLFFTLAGMNVITKDFKLDENKLLGYINKYNELN